MIEELYEFLRELFVLFHDDEYSLETNHLIRILG